MWRDRWRLSLLPWLIGALSLGLTGWLWWHEQLIVQRTLKAELDFSVRQTASRVESRIATYEQMLRGVQGLFQAADAVTQPQFDAYVDRLLAGADFAGIQFFAHAAMTPVMAGAAESTRVTRVAPATSSSLKLLGKDLYGHPERRSAIQLAGDSTGFAITPPLAGLYAQEPAAEPGFLMFLPVYAKGLSVDTAAARRAALEGWVVAGVRINDLMASLYGEGTPGVDVRVYDGVKLDATTLLYQASPRPSLRPHHEVLEYIGVAGRTWTLAVSAGAAFERRAGQDSAQLIAWSGLGGTLLLTLLTHQLVSGRQRARDVALAMTRELRASEERYRRIVETADEGIWVTDPTARTSFVNPKMGQMLGYTPVEMHGHPLADFVDAASPFETEPDPAMRPPGQAQRRELRFRRKDGSLVWASMTTSPVVDAAGRPAGALAMVTDITATKQSDAAHRELEAQLRESQKMEAIGTLAGGIAHDFNNILAAILGNVSLAQAHVGLDPAVQSSLEQIGKGATRARSLVQQILAFSRRQPHRLVNQALGPVIEESVRLLRPVLPALAELDVELADTPLHVLADATQVQQVIMNLCTNASHALQGCAGRITIGLDAVALDVVAAHRLGLPAGRHAHLWVRDTGCGMDEANRQRVFEPFFTTKPVGQGTGLGLSVVHGIVASHGGAISVASQPGQGTRFDLYLPLLAQPPGVPVTPVAAPEPRSATGRHLVYIDDDPVMVTMVQALMQNAGYRVSCFERPLDALAALRVRPDAVDVVVTDYNMPQLSGLDVAREVARMRPGLPVVISSGYVSQELLAKAAEAGVRSVLQKEFTVEQLPRLVQGILAGLAAMVM